MDKLYLEFDTAFWDDNGKNESSDPDWFNYAGNGNTNWLQTLNVFKYLGKPILVLFNVASDAATFQTKTDDQVVASAMKVIQQMFP